jgi:hypothetical protein
MSNTIIYKAAEIINATGKQLNAMFEKIAELFPGMLAEYDGFKYSYLERSSQSLDDSNWLRIDKESPFNFREKSKKYDNFCIDYYALIYSKADFESCENWEPSLHVFIEKQDTPDGQWRMSEEFTAANACEQFNRNREKNMWVWEGDTTGCMFTVRLTAIENEETLRDKIIAPSLYLARRISEGADVKALTPPRIATMFTPKGS